MADRSKLIRLAAKMPKGSPVRRKLLASLKSSGQPEMRLKGRKVEVNLPFLLALQRKRRAHIIPGSPQGGFTYVHPDADTDPNFSGGSEYDFYFSPKRDEKGWYNVSYTPGYLMLLQKDADKLGVKPTRMASGKKARSSFPKGNPHIPDSFVREARSVLEDLDNVSFELRDLGKKAKKFWSDMEDSYWDAHKEWVAQGNHPDAFNDPRDNPSGAAMYEALQWAEVLARIVGVKNERGTVSGKVGSALMELHNHLT